VAAHERQSGGKRRGARRQALGAQRAPHADAWSRGRSVRSLCIWLGRVLRYANRYEIRRCGCVSFMWSHFHDALGSLSTQATRGTGHGGRRTGRTPVTESETRARPALRQSGTHTHTRTPLGSRRLSRAPLQPGRDTSRDNTTMNTTRQGTDTAVSVVSLCTKTQPLRLSWHPPVSLSTRSCALREPFSRVARPHQYRRQRE
jgi:hypothetical protein